MPRPPHDSQQHIAAAFVKELEAFKRGGYKFAGSDRELFEGTQREAFNDYLEGVQQRHLEGYFEIPTGVGKTALFIAIIGCYLKATENIPDAPRVLIHEPTDDLVKQTALAFADFIPAIAPEIEADDEQGRQIDWERSEVGIKRKGAKSDRKIVITTYQGQTADERNYQNTMEVDLSAYDSAAEAKVASQAAAALAEAQRLYKPNAYGLVIHDEAHYLTGRKYGPAAVDKFRGAIQLGVTATPEYSTDKTVANKLGHRYFDLPLNTAIERGDLCHVRPIVLKTHLRGKDAINLEKARDFLQQQHGQPLTKKQLEQLLNQEARNQAIIKAYLTGSHPDTEERFLGQTGMIFAGGIPHCNDFILHTERVLNQPAYRRVKQWLRDEGVALIAPIHSDIPHDGVEINFGGQRKKCTKDEIKELHRQGKILLIISDQELKLGSDFPMDSFIVDAVDRFSVPDATQRMGRGFRVDRGDERRNLPPNPFKSCAAINVIDETTHEMYAGTPHHPIHATEILNGAEHRPPGRRTGALTRFKAHPPELSEGLESLGFEVITRADAMRAIVRRFEHNQQRRLPEKTEEWLSPKDISTTPGGQRVPIKTAVKAIIAAYDEERSGEQTVEYNAQSIRVQKVQAGPKQPVCIHREDWLKVEKAAGVSAGVKLPAKTDEWLSSSDVSEIPGGNRVPVQAAMKAIVALYDEKRMGEQQIQYNGQSIRVQKLQAGTTQPICICRDDWPDVEMAAGVNGGTRLPEKTDEWLSLWYLGEIPGGLREPVVAAAKAIIAAYDEERSGEQPVEYNGQSIRVQKLQAASTQPICIWRGDWPKVEIAAGVSAGVRLPAKTDEWLSAPDIRKLPGGRRVFIETAMKAIIAAYDEEQPGEQPVEYNGQSIRVQKLQAGTKQPICIHRDDWPKLEIAANEHNRQASEGRKAPLLPKKDITPGSDHLKRTGRSRGGPEE